MCGQLCYKHCGPRGVGSESDLGPAPKFTPGQPGVCNLSDVPVDPLILAQVNVGGADPGKANIITMDRGPKEKYTAQEYYGAMRKTDASTAAAAVTASAKAKLDCAKAAEAERMVHHFRVLTTAELWNAARVSQRTAQALTVQYARPAAMKRGLAIYSRGQARTLSIIDMVTQAVSMDMDPTKPIVIALGRNYKGMRARLGDKCTPVCKAVLDILKRHFMVVLIDEYLTSQMCNSCHTKLAARKGNSCEKYCNRCGCDVDRDINAAKNMLAVFECHVNGWGRS